MGENENFSCWVDELPDDPMLLKEYIRYQSDLLGKQVLELEIVRYQCRDIRRLNRTLQALIWPSN